MSLSRVIDGLTGAIAVAAVCAAVYVLHGKQPNNAPARSTKATASEWKIANREGHILGPSAAKVVIVEFADFECPFCDAMRAVLDSLRSLHPDVAIRFRHLPIPSHRYARDAAVASECAARQRRFDQYHDLLYDDSKLLGLLDWTTLAARVSGMDTASFRECLANRGPAVSAVARDIADADGLHIAGTPAFFIGQRRLVGTFPLQELLDAVEAERTRLRDIGLSLNSH